MSEWEYTVQALPDFHYMEDCLNDFGVEGWELVALDFKAQAAVFKRPARPEPPALLVVNNIPGTDFQQLIDSLKAELDRYWEEKEVRRDP